MSPRISFSYGEAVVHIWQNTVDALETPQYYRFLFDNEKLRFAIQKCRYMDEGAKRLRKSGNTGYRIISLPLIKTVYEACKWDRKYSYRIDGVVSPDKQAIVFYLPDGVQASSAKED